jgi:hypothetical protein
MKISAITGHLTPTDKRHIKALFESGKTQAKINRAIWAIESGSPSDGVYTIIKYVNDRGLGWIGSELRQSKYTFRVRITK